MYEPTQHSLTVGELKDKLKTVPDETKILIYTGEVEEYGNLEKIKAYPAGSNKDMPYSKGDVPETKIPFILFCGRLV